MILGHFHLDTPIFYISNTKVNNTYYITLSLIESKIMINISILHQTLS